MNVHQAIADLKIAIDGILVAHPDLAEDLDFACEVLSAETEIENILALLVDWTNDAKAMASAVKARKMELGERQSRFEIQEDAYRRLIQSIMERANLPKIVLTEATLSIRHIPPAPIVVDEALLPDKFFRIKREPDMKLIKATMDSERVNIPGVCLSNGHSSLTIRTK